jgi:hypothetical protein
MIDVVGTLKYQKLSDTEWVLVFTLSGMKSLDECADINRILYDALVDAGGEIAGVELG